MKKISFSTNCFLSKICVILNLFQNRISERFCDPESSSGRRTPVIYAILTALLLFCPASFAQDAVVSENIAYLTKQGFFDKPQASFLSPYEEIKKTLYAHLKYANGYNLEGLKALYADNYMNSDGINKDIYFDLIKKTWESYPDIKYKMDIREIEITGNTAVVQLNEGAVATTETKSSLVNQKGLLESASSSVYYLKKLNNEWLLTSDHILLEKTSLRYGSAKNINVSLDTPNQVPADTQYTASLKIEAPRKNMIIASIGRENITYPQVIAEEVFRKLPPDGILERVLKSNNNNINEYTVASFGVTEAELKKGPEIKISITGVGFIMSRVNVIPKNNFVKVADNEKTE